MGMRVQTSGVADLRASWFDTPGVLEEAYGLDDDVTVPALVIEDPGNSEAWIISGTAGELRGFVGDLAACLVRPALQEIP